MPDFVDPSAEHNQETGEAGQGGRTGVAELQRS